ncbi:MAG: hypothetical protein H6Q70_1273 [Firmicutes bacterium]|nr:hypothetical protein [Bacillota bacterium]
MTINFYCVSYDIESNGNNVSFIQGGYIMVNNISSTSGFFGIEDTGKVKSNKSQINQTSSLETSNANKSSQSSGAQESKSEIMVVDGQKILVITYGMFKMQLNLGPANLENPKLGKIDNTADGKLDSTGKVDTDSKDVKGTSNGLSQAENQYLQNDAIASGFATGITFNSGV